MTLISDLDLERWHCPWYYTKFLPQGIHMRNMKALSSHSEVMRNFNYSFVKVTVIFDLDLDRCP